MFEVNNEFIHAKLNEKLVKHEPYVDDEGVWYPCEEYTPEWMDTNYKLVISKKMFVEAYNKWIKGE
jgi:hypothetical protein